MKQNTKRSTTWSTWLCDNWVKERNALSWQRHLRGSSKPWKFKDAVQFWTRVVVAVEIDEPLRIINSGADPGFFLMRGCTLFLFYFNTNKPHSFLFLQNTSCIRKPQVISSGGWGVRTPCTLPLYPPLLLDLSTVSRKIKGPLLAG